MPSEDEKTIFAQIWSAMLDLPGYQQGVQLGDAEFGIAVAPYLDPQDRHLINPKQARFVEKPPSTRPLLKGVNNIGNPAIRHGDTVLPANTITAFGAENANPALFAHEFRHGAPQVEGGEHRIRFLSELRNRQEDLFHAQSPRDVEIARFMIRNILESVRPGEVTDKALDAYIATVMDRQINEHQQRNLDVPAN